LWDAKTAEDSGRNVSVLEQHIHSFLVSLPLMSGAAEQGLYRDQVQALLHPPAGSLAAALEAAPTAGGYLAAIGPEIVGLIALPYGEELLRCIRASRRSASGPILGSAAGQGTRRR
jgi:hypothetical protein